MFKKGISIGSGPSAGSRPSVRRAEIVVIGNEVTSGFIQETNSRFISTRLGESGVDVSRITCVGDEASAITAVVKDAMKRVDLVIATGGLGSTHDDITKQALARLFRSRFKTDEKVWQMIAAFYRVRGRIAPDCAFQQCEVPHNADILYNEKGTAPGLMFHGNGKKVYALPGIPLEMEYLMDKYVIPAAVAGAKIRIGHRTLKTTGIAESNLWEKIGSVQSLEKKQMVIASLPSHLGVKIRMSAFGSDARKVAAKLDAAERFFHKKAGDLIYSQDQEEMEDVVGRLLRKNQLTLATAESCTGGLAGHRITNVSGSSDYFLQGVVAYSNAAKTQRLGVGEDILKRHGAVSAEVAQVMADGVRKSSGADIGLAVTGIAGPTGGSKAKPVGLTYIALSAKKHLHCEKFIFPQDRVRNKERAAQAALNMLRLWLLGIR